MGQEIKQTPSWFYGPDGDAAVFDDADAVPKGWADHPAKVKKPGGSHPGKSVTKESPE